jgi:hypothetical protein
MSTSLSIVNGDLVIGSGRKFETVSGKAKLMQDLKLWVLEKIGSDPLLPTYGSILDGGKINGQIVDSLIGGLATQENINNIRISTIDLLDRYQSMQFEKMRGESLIYNGKNTLDADEVIDEIISVNVAQVETTIMVQVILTTLAGSTLKLTIPLNEA